MKPSFAELFIATIERLGVTVVREKCVGCVLVADDYASVFAI
jgi:hypothetical protein